MTRVELMAVVGLALLTLGGCKGKATESASATGESVVTIGKENIAVAQLVELRSGPAISGTLEVSARSMSRSSAVLIS